MLSPSFANAAFLQKRPALLFSVLVCAERSADIVKANDPHIHPELLVIGGHHLLDKQLLPAVAFLGVR